MNKQQLERELKYAQLGSLLLAFLAISLIITLVYVIQNPQDGQANCSPEEENVLEVNAIKDFQILKVNCKEGSEFINNGTFLGCIEK